MAYTREKMTGGKRRIAVRWKDDRGRWREKWLPVGTSERDAMRLGQELEMRADRIVAGLEVLPDPCKLTLGQLMDWWLEHHMRGKASYVSAEGRVRNHLASADVATKPADRVTPGDLQAWLRAKEGKLSAQTLNHLRQDVCGAYREAIRAETYRGRNPTDGVQKAKVVRRKPDYLRADEVRKVLASVTPEWRPLFATAIYTGLRKGELFALRKSDLDLPNRLLYVRGSHDRDRTKDGHEGTVPISDELLPYLQTAIAASPSIYLFCTSGGEQHHRSTRLEERLRAALKRASIVTEWHHKCRRCGLVVMAADDARRQCPAGCMAMWPSPQVRPIRFHDLRHTTASLLVNDGASGPMVQGMMRHKNLRTTMEVYAHLDGKALLETANRLRFAPKPDAGTPLPTAPAPVTAVPAPATRPGGVVRHKCGGANTGHGPVEVPKLAVVRPKSDYKVPVIMVDSSERETGLEPATFSLGMSSGHLTVPAVMRIVKDLHDA